MSPSADGDVGGAQAGELVCLGSSVVVDRLGVRHCLQRGDDQLSPESGDVVWMTEALEMPLQLVDHEAVELGEALDERSRPRGAPQQLVEPIGVVPEHCSVDERSAQLLDVRFLGSQPLRQHLDERSDLVEMSIGQRDEQRILVREVLVQRSDRDLGGFGHLVRRRRVVPALVENASSLVQDTGVERPRPLLNRSFAGRPWKVGDHDAHVLISDEHGGVVRTWRHELVVASIDDTSCRYTDRIDIDAGILTPVIVAFAHVFYRYRQRRWRELARLLAATVATQPSATSRA